MSQSDVEQQAPEIALESSTYEIIRNRLSGHGRELRTRLDKLNHLRKEVFGSIETELKSTERITTSNNCVSRDMVAVGNKFIFGYNVHLGLKSVTEISDVFAVYEFHEDVFQSLPLEFLGDERFASDFQEVYRYYKNAVFAKFFLKGPHLYMVFRVGKSVTDIKAFKWLIEGDSLRYVDNRSEHEIAFPSQHEFAWKRTHRNMHQEGIHPHISIEDRVFVEAVGGDLTIKIENNTDTGEGIYSEPVDDADQTLDDAEVFYAIVGNIILLRMRPYQEDNYRHFVFNEKIGQAQRLDAVADACVFLPDDHGLIFSNGYYLQSGEYKTFESGLSEMIFERRIAAPNGEDYLYVFYNRESGDYVLLHYNLIERKVDTPIVCNGFMLFEAGELICFKAQSNPQKHHALQTWQTPYVGDDYDPETQSDSYLNKIGNRDIVKGMAECHEVLKLIDKEDIYANLYVDLVRESGEIVDSYFWIGNDEACDLREPLVQIKQAASSAVEEYDKVVRVRQETNKQTSTVRNKTREVLTAIRNKRFDNINDFVGSLGDLRTLRGEIISLKDLRYVNEQLVEELEHDVKENSERLANRCVEFLLKPDALKPYIERVKQEHAEIEGLAKVSEARKLEEEIVGSGEELEMLIDIVSNLKIDDATQRTAIIDNISTIFSSINQARAELKKKIKGLLSVEGVAEFNSQMKLLSQSVVNYLDICDSPERCEEYLTKVMIQLEELEGRFAEFDEFIEQLTEKREEVYNAFESRKLALLEARNKRSNALAQAADRILKGIKHRVEGFESVEEINGYFAADLMIEKVRDICAQLGELDESVKVDDIQSRMKTVREDAVRQLKDRQELFVEGENVIRLGTHNFSVNVQALDLTTVMRDNDPYLHLTGTRFFEKIVDPALEETRSVWNQEVISENHEVYRAEYLANIILNDTTHPKDNDEENRKTITELQALKDDELQSYVNRFMAPRYVEAYTKGVHDRDAAFILRNLLEMTSNIGMLRFRAEARALAAVFWENFTENKQKTLMASRLKGVGVITDLFPAAGMRTHYIEDLQNMLGIFLEDHNLFSATLVEEAAEYLFFELSGEGRFSISKTAAELSQDFKRHLKQFGYDQQFAESVKTVRRSPASCFLLLRNWVTAFVESRDAEDQTEYIDEIAWLLLREKTPEKEIIDAQVSCTVEKMIGSHPVFVEGNYHLHFNHFMTKLDLFQRETVPLFEQYTSRKKELVEIAREEMKLEEFRPRVLTSFVRNKLLDEVYLPLIGDNLAKQLGTAGEGKRTDRMGLLLLVSPPGYGKTTLMEYIANRLGLIFMKINGPAIGHQVTSLDPQEAPNAAAREEIEKLNLALEMGDNVMIYLDDIQHSNPEFLQKFISLCDATRKIEGIYKGRTKTYDLRGRKVCVIMAGNPYTESGEKFQIPDMLSNRADIYNLGEIIGENSDVFEMSYLENSLTSNPVLNKLATRSQKDIYAIIKMAQNESQEGIDLEGSYSVEELTEMVSTVRKLMRVRDVILSVNREYIRSAAQSDEYRTEPPFKLQGSYRNMNRIAEKVVPILNDDELETLIISNYENDAQTLTSDTEANLLKFKELIGHLSKEEKTRWENIKRTFKQNIKMRGVDADDKLGLVIAQMGDFSDGLHAIRETMNSGIDQFTEREDSEPTEPPLELDRHVEQLVERLEGLEAGLQSIGESFTGGMRELAELSLSQTSEESTPTPQLDVQLLKELVAELRETAPQSAEPQLAEPETQETQEEPEPDVEVVPPSEAPPESDQPQRITIVNKIPPTLVNVLKQQFKLMEGWMEPILTSSLAQSDDIQDLKKKMDQCLNDYAKLIKRMSKS